MLSFLKRHKLSILTIIGLIALIGGSFYFRQKQNGSKLKFASVKKTKVTETISASGFIGAQDSATLRFQTSGLLVWIGAKEGDYVKKGQAIASLDKRELEKNLKKELNDYLNERWDFEQSREDYKVQYEQDYNYPDVLTDEIRRILQKNQHDLNNAILDVEIKNLAIRLATITTPIDGIVIDIEQPFTGINITPAGAEITIANPKTVEFAAEVDEVDIGKIKVGQKANLALDAYPDEKFNQKVKSIDFSSTTTKGGGTAYLVKISLPENKKQKFKLGMNGDAQFVVAEKKQVLSVPQKTIVSKDDETAVWVIDKNNKAQLKKIELGAQTAETAEVKEGIKEGDSLIVEGFEELKEGEKINVDKAK